jgi:hypothetical protein
MDTQSVVYGAVNSSFTDAGELATLRPGRPTSTRPGSLVWSGDTPDRPINECI